MDIKSSGDGAAGFKPRVDGGVHLRPDIGKIIPNFFAFELTDVIGNSDFAFLTESGYFLKGIMRIKFRGVVFASPENFNGASANAQDAPTVQNVSVRQSNQIERVFVGDILFLGIENHFLSVLAEVVLGLYGAAYPELEEHREFIFTELEKEEAKFSDTLVKGEREFEKMLPNLMKGNSREISGRLAFKLYDTYGFPIELTVELAKEHGFTVDEKGFNEAFEKHQQISRAGAEGTFKGGLADNSEATTALHTATHLLHKALCVVLGGYVKQLGSNITAERLRFDFNNPAPLTKEQLKQVEDIVNEQIQKDLPVICETMTLEEAKALGAAAQFDAKYGEKVKVYSIGDFSKEVCGGPHVEHTGDMGHFVIKKEQSSSAGVRRIKAVLEK